jgi:predicted nuclease of restriction endonuclease-like (RecB) superfamily
MQYCSGFPFPGLPKVVTVLYLLVHQMIMTSLANSCMGKENIVSFFLLYCILCWRFSDIGSMKELSEFAEVHQMITAARVRAFHTVNAELIRLYWEIGRYIDDKVKAELWGQGVVDALAVFIARKEPEIQGFSTRNLWRMRQFYETYAPTPALAALLTELSWTNNLVILARTKDDSEREFYIRLSIQEKFSKRDLERAISTSTYERRMLTENKNTPVVREARFQFKEHFKDTYILDFLNLPKEHDEKNLRKSIIQNLREFIMELGGDFTFVGEEYRVLVGNTDFHIDLLFYHRALQCLVAMDLKVEKFKPEFISKMSFYLEALDRKVKKGHENPSVGIILCKDKDKEIVEYAMSRDMSPTLVAEYRTKLIEKSQLQLKMQELFRLQEPMDEG